MSFLSYKQIMRDLNSLVKDIIFFGHLAFSLIKAQVFCNIHGKNHCYVINVNVCICRISAKQESLCKFTFDMIFVEFKCMAVHFQEHNLIKV